MVDLEQTTFLDSSGAGRAHRRAQDRPAGRRRPPGRPPDARGAERLRADQRRPAAAAPGERRGDVRWLSLAVTAAATPDVVDLVLDELDLLWARDGGVAPDDRRRFETGLVEVLGNVVEHGGVGAREAHRRGPPHPDRAGRRARRRRPPGRAGPRRGDDARRRTPSPAAGSPSRSPRWTTSTTSASAAATAGRCAGVRSPGTRVGGREPALAHGLLELRDERLAATARGQPAAPPSRRSTPGRCRRPAASAPQPLGALLARVSARRPRRRRRPAERRGTVVSPPTSGAPRAERRGERPGPGPPARPAARRSAAPAQEVAAARAGASGRISVVGVLAERPAAGTSGGPARSSGFSRWLGDQRHSRRPAAATSRQASRLPAIAEGVSSWTALRPQPAQHPRRARGPGSSPKQVAQRRTLVGDSSGPSRIPVALGQPAAEQVAPSARASSAAGELVLDPRVERPGSTRRPAAQSRPTPSSGSATS